MITEWLHWYYLIYLVPAGTAVLVLLTSGLGGHHGGLARGGHGGSHFHLSHGATHHGGGPAHSMAHSPAAAPAHAHAPTGSHAPGHSHASHGSRPVTAAPGVARQLLGFFGVGRAPLPLMLGSLMIGWGFFGLAATEALRPLLRFPALFALPSMAVAAVGSLLTAKLFGELAARVMPKDESYALSRDALLGLTGKVVFPVSETAGRVHLYDQFHTLHVAPARVTPGSPPIGRGTSVIVASADPDHRFLIVEPLGFTTGSKSLP